MSIVRKVLIALSIVPIALWMASAIASGDDDVSRELVIETVEGGSIALLLDRYGGTLEDSIPEFDAYLVIYPTPAAAQAALSRMLSDVPRDPNLDNAELHDRLEDPEGVGHTVPILDRTAGPPQFRNQAAGVTVRAALAHVTDVEASVTPDLMLLFAVAAGVTAGPARGATIAFTFGIAFDLMVHTPFGLSALCYTLVAYGLAQLQTGLLRGGFLVPALTTFLASAAGVGLWAVTAALFGQTYLLSYHLIAVVVVVGLVNVLLAPLARRLMQWAATADGGVRLGRL